MSNTTKAQIKRATLEAQRRMYRLDEAGIEELMRLYRQAADDLRRRIAGHAGGDGNITVAEMRNLLNQVESLLSNLAQEQNAVLRDGLQQAAEQGAMAGTLDAAAAMQVSEDAVRFVQTFVAADGLALSDRLWRLDRGAKEAITGAIELAVVQGHSSAQAAREFLARGQNIPPDVADRLGAGNGVTLGNIAADLLTGDGKALYQAQRVFRTEINRAHGEAYMAGVFRHPEVVGVRFLLSPRHPKHDICDLLAEQNLYGLGHGVYPSREKCPWPAHPNTLSFVEPVFADEVSAADRSGKETPMQALERLSPEIRAGVLGKGKAEIFDAGDLSAGMIRSPLSAVQRRIG